MKNLNLFLVHWIRFTIFFFQKAPVIHWRGYFTFTWKVVNWVIYSENELSKEKDIWNRHVRKQKILEEIRIKSCIF